MPVLIATPFATNGTKNNIPETDGAQPQNATMDEGFPAITQQPISTGGIPPERADFNGILYALSDNISHINKGLAYSFDTTFATKIGGYPLHSELVMADGTRAVSTIANNMNNPDVDLTGWRKGVPASDVSDDSGLSQQAINDKNKNKTSSFVSGAEFGLVANSLDDQTTQFDTFVDYLRSSKKRGLLEAGRYIVNCNKTKTFGVVGEANYREEKYAIDISGVDIEGVVAGYRNANGTIIKCLAQDGTALMQAQTSVSFITHNIKGVKVENANLALRWTYSVGSNLENFYFDNTCLNGMALGDATLAMPLLNRFKSINGECVNRPLITDGNGGCNLNYFEELYIMGNLPSKLTATGGYGAVSNLFVSCEFASRATGTTGLELGRTRSTTLINSYFEAHKNCLKITDSTTALKIINPVLSGMLSFETQAAFILHDTAAVCDVSIDGGTVFANEINDTRLFGSIDPTKLYVNIIKNPQVVTNKTGYRVMEFNTFKTLAGFTGFYEDTFTPTWSASGATPSGFTTAQGNISVQGKVATVSYNFILGGSMTLPTGNYYPELPRNVKANCPAIGGARIRRENAVDGRTEVIAQSFADSSFLQILLQQISATYNDTTKTVAIKNNSASASNTTLAGYENGSFIKASITYIMA